MGTAPDGPGAVRAGGTATTLVTGLNLPEGVAVYGNHIYWANLGASTIDRSSHLVVTCGNGC